MTMPNQTVQQAIVVTQASMNGDRNATRLALFDESGDALDIGGGESTPTAWADITGKPAVIGAGADAASARAAIGAGTSSLAVGSTVGSALAGSGSAGVSASPARADHVHPFPSAANVGAAATSHTHVGTQMTLTGYAIGTAAAVAPTDTLNAAIAKLEARVLALETP